MERLIKDDDIILDGTLPRYEKEKNAFHKLYLVEEILEKYGIEDLHDLNHTLCFVKIILEYMFYRPSFYVDQGNWGRAYISMAYLEPDFAPKEYEFIKTYMTKKGKIKDEQSDNH